MKWKQFFATLSDAQRREAAAALRSMETPQQETERLRVDVKNQKRAVEKLRVNEARRQAEDYAAQRNRQTGGAL